MLVRQGYGYKRNVVQSYDSFCIPVHIVKIYALYHIYLATKPAIISSLCTYLGIL